jgi:hypothetical protein
MYESGEIISVYHGIKAIALVMEPHKLNAILKGQISYIDDNATSAKARDTSFELIVASRLAQIPLPLVSLPPADICAILDKRRLVFECKRPQSVDTVEGNIDDAFSQLRGRLREARLPRMRGIAAIDITKAANPDFQRLRVAYLKEMTDKQSEFGANYARAHIGEWFRRAADKKIVAVLLRFSCIAEIVETRMPIYAQQYHLVSIAVPDTSGQRLTGTLAQALAVPPVWAGITHATGGKLA